MKLFNYIDEVNLTEAQKDKMVANIAERARAKPQMSLVRKNMLAIGASLAAVALFFGAIWTFTDVGRGYSRPHLPPTETSSAPSLPSAPPKISLVLPEVGINPEMIPIIEEFLSRFPTISTDLVIPGMQMNVDGGTVYFWQDWRRHYDSESWTEIPVTTEIPEFYYRPYCHDTGINGGYFDKDGNRLSEEEYLWIWGDRYATRFLLTDWTGNGIPEIHIGYFGFSHHSGHWDDYRLFRFVDGEYRVVRQKMNDNSGRYSDSWQDGNYYKSEQGNLYISIFYPDGSVFYSCYFDDNNIAHISVVAA